MFGDHRLFMSGKKRSPCECLVVTMTKGAKDGPWNNRLRGVAPSEVREPIGHR